MTISEFETKRCERIVGAFIDARRPPPHVRPGLDLGYRVTGQRLELEMTVTDPATFTEPAILTKSWTWRPGLEVLPFECAEE